MGEAGLRPRHLETRRRLAGPLDRGAGPGLQASGAQPSPGSEGGAREGAGTHVRLAGEEGLAPGVSQQGVPGLVVEAVLFSPRRPQCSYLPVLLPGLLDLVSGCMPLCDEAAAVLPTLPVEATCFQHTAEVRLVFPRYLFSLSKKVLPLHETSCLARTGPEPVKWG